MPASSSRGHSAAVTCRASPSSRCEHSASGRRPDRRSLLVVLDLTGKQCRVEVGPNLEFLFTDAYSSYLAHDLIGPMLATDAAPMRVMSALFHALRLRIDEALLGQEWDPAQVSAIRERQRLALGGGADAAAQLADLNRLANQPSSPGIAARYGAQPTAADALARYLEWVQEPFAYVDVGLVSAGSRDILTDINGDISVGAWRFDQLATRRERYTLVEREGRAVAIPTVSPLSHPAWFVRGRNGWQMELLPEFLIVRSVQDEPWRWTVLMQNDPWIRIFGDLTEQMPGSEVVRFRDGNNTAIPGRGHID